MRFQITIAAASIILSSFIGPVAARVTIPDHRWVARVDDAPTNTTLGADATLFNTTQLNATYANSTPGQDAEDVECEDEDEQPLAPSAIVNGTASPTSGILPSASTMYGSDDENDEEECDEEEGDESPNPVAPITGDAGDDEEECEEDEEDEVPQTSQSPVQSAVASNKVLAAGTNPSNQPAKALAASEPVSAPLAANTEDAGCASATTVYATVTVTETTTVMPGPTSQAPSSPSSPPVQSSSVSQSPSSSNNAPSNNYNAGGNDGEDAEDDEDLPYCDDEEEEDNAPANFTKPSGSSSATTPKASQSSALPADGDDDADEECEDDELPNAIASGSRADTPPRRPPTTRSLSSTLLHPLRTRVPLLLV